MKKKVFDSRDTVMKNGIRLITIKRETQIASVHCGIKIGPIYEEIEEKGISHFIEHMMFKGTKNRNNEELNDCLEQLGGEYNAYTDYTSTVYSITALEEELEAGIWLLSDMLVNSTFPGEEIEKERSVILAEIRTSKDDIEDLSFRKINAFAFKENALKHEIIGEEKNIIGFDREQLMNFYQRYYVPNNCFITVVSSMDHDYVENMVERYFSDWIGRDFKLKEVVQERNLPGTSINIKKAIEQSTITFLYTFYNLNKEQELALKILNHKFGESANSILFRELREERGLAYDVYTHLDMSVNVKTLYIYTSVSSENIDEAINVIEDCINRIKNESISFDEKVVNLMKKVLKTAVASTLEDSSDLGNYALHQCIDGESIYEFVEDMENMNNIKEKHIYDIARLVFCDPTIHILKPKK
jgi:predicted Zn-dependent peptidase